MAARSWMWTAAAFGAYLATAAQAGAVPEALTFGVFADPQHGEREAAGSRFYRDSPAKLAECIQAFARAKPAFVICLGDFVDGTSRDFDTEMRHLRTIDGLFRRFEGPRYHVLGNHDLDALTKDEFLKATGMPAAHYAFDAAPFRCLVLDACYRKGFEPYARGNFVWTDSWVPPDQLRWLEGELRKAEGKVLVFTHQPLDSDDVHCVRNAADVRRILEDSGKVTAVFSGHDHKGGSRRVRGIPYFTICGMVEGPGVERNAYALVTVSPAGRIRIQGFGSQPSSTLE